RDDRPAGAVPAVLLPLAQPQFAHDDDAVALDDREADVARQGAVGTHVEPAHAAVDHLTGRAVEVIVIHGDAQVRPRPAVLERTRARLLADCSDEDIRDLHVAVLPLRRTGRSHPLAGSTPPQQRTAHYGIRDLWTTAAPCPGARAQGGSAEPTAVTQEGCGSAQPVVDATVLVDHGRDGLQERALRSGPDRGLQALRDVIGCLPGPLVPLARGP